MVGGGRSEARAHGSCISVEGEEEQTHGRRLDTDLLQLLWVDGRELRDCTAAPRGPVVVLILHRLHWAALLTRVTAAVVPLGLRILMLLRRRLGPLSTLGHLVVLGRVLVLKLVWLAELGLPVPPMATPGIHVSDVQEIVLTPTNL